MLKITLPGKVMDGVSIFYFSRANSSRKEIIIGPVLSFKKVKSARFNFTGAERTI
jgi:hypothetical protein